MCPVRQPCGATASTVHRAPRLWCVACHHYGRCAITLLQSGGAAKEAGEVGHGGVQAGARFGSERSEQVGGDVDALPRRAAGRARTAPHTLPAPARARTTSRGITLSPLLAATCKPP